MALRGMRVTAVIACNHCSQMLSRVLGAASLSQAGTSGWSKLTPGAQSMMKNGAPATSGSRQS